MVPSLRGRFVDETEEDGVEDLVKKRKQSVNGGKSASITLRNTCGVPAKSVILAETIEYLKHLKGRVMKLKLRSELLSCQLINRSRFKEE